MTIANAPDMQSAPDMEQDTQLVTRVPKDLADRLKTYADHLSADFGVPVSVAAAVRRLLVKGLDDAGIPKPEADASDSDSAEEGAA